MALRPNKGTAPATGKVKPSRAELLMSATQALATEQLPDPHTMDAIEGPAAEDPTEAAPAAGAPSRSPAGETTTVEANVAPAAADVAGSEPPAPKRARAPRASADEAPAAPPTSSAASAAAEASRLEVREMPLDAIHPSPFQPKGRPSAAAVTSVREAVARAGSLDALVSPDGAPLFMRLTAEAARLAELAYDVAEHGLRVPVEVRPLGDGRLECLSGHRRLAAARLAGLDTVPGIDRGPMSNAAAAATVLRGNLHRENFTTWQEAALVTEVQERRRADGYRDNVRTLGAVMGWSHGKVNMLLRIRRSLSPELLARAGGGDPAPVEERLARAAYRDLERLASEADDARRLTALRRLLGLDDAPAGAVHDRPVCVLRPRRGGGFLIEVNAPVETLAAGDAELLRTHLETQLTRVNARLGALGRH
ncbi:ParB domain protein nuclease (plasmid) [Gemmatirosa kalamazoonensis]|uniref:ParB domain protein nuclease n=1 Tax=Gemmatirosa kalamazoonensis TaxID=861299 RepID=W0RPW4_9BACT|nr:ParB N-terminal domain-containing protein [Gemmatirosa kalamazoonensis]AHG93044.1 ParB domain protein nuclease [Gemmatirosa kalamazoonensis]